MARKLTLLLLILFSLGFYTFANSANVIDKLEYVLYVPSGIEAGNKYPLVISLSPNADAQGMINAWKAISEEYKWIIFASKEFKNGQPLYSSVNNRIIKSVKDLFLKYPIDANRIIASGISGGGQASHGFAFMFPELISAVVVNTCRINGYFLEKGVENNYPRNKAAVFLASPTDFRYKEMKRDRMFLESLGWKTKWIEFQGGHIMAPESCYREAVRWLEDQFK